MSLVLAAWIFGWVIPRFADYRDAWGVLELVSGRWLAAIAGLGVASRAIAPLNWRAVIPHLSYGQALAANLASTSAANTLPGGGAVGAGLTYSMLSGWGHRRPRIAVGLLITGIWNNAIKLALPVGALVLLTLSGRESPELITAAILGAAILVGGVAITGIATQVAGRRLSGRPAGALRRLLARFTGGPGRLTAEASEVVGRRWAQLTLATAARHVLLFGVLLASLRGVGIDADTLPWTEVVAAFAVVRLISVLPITPGNLGIAELGYAAILAASVPEAAADRVVAAVLLFRFVTHVAPLPAGGIAFLWWRSRGAGRQADEAPVENRPGLEEVDCFRCGLPGDLVHRLEPFAVVACPRCGQAFISPRLDHAARLEMYGDPAYFDDGVYDTPSASFLQRRWSRGRLDVIAGHLDEGGGGRLFELGCAYGLFLEEARALGHQVAGLELSPVAARTAAARLGVPVFEGEITRYDGGEQHDAVVAWDVIEHVPDPAAFLAAAVERVAPGGILALSCPYYDSIPARMLGRRWWTLKPKKHLWHFTRGTLRRLLDESGLMVERIVLNPLARANFLRFDSLVVVARKPR